MKSTRVTAQRFVFSGSGTQDVVVPNDAFVNVYSAEVNVNDDCVLRIEIGSTIISESKIIANAQPVQLFWPGFGKGKGTGVYGDDLKVMLTDVGVVFLDYVITYNS